jgi:hypothetical protein
MSDLFLLSKAQMRRIEPYFPLSHGIPPVDDRRVSCSILLMFAQIRRRRLIQSARDLL